MIREDRNYRKEIVDVIMSYAREDERIVLLVCDMGFGVADNFNKEFPDRIYNMGIMEQGTVGIAARHGNDWFNTCCILNRKFSCISRLGADKK